jgi:hypothetical protein
MGKHFGFSRYQMKLQALRKSGLHLLSPLPRSRLFYSTIDGAVLDHAAPCRGWVDVSISAVRFKNR